MKYLSPFKSRYGITPFSSSSLTNLEKEFEKLFSSLPSLFDIEGEVNVDSGNHSLGPRWYENEDAFIAQVELPGVEAKDVLLEVGDNALSLTAERKSRSKEDESESSISYSESFSIPEGVDSDKVSGAFKEGILSITFPKSEVAKPRRIEVN